uniref:WAP domain-containing protein n=1 Tax=Kryptolebias marmoratus TaxID=37003 RepID=A0A3Q3ARY5_KRYMA
VMEMTSEKKVSHDEGDKVPCFFPLILLLGIKQLNFFVLDVSGFCGRPLLTNVCEKLCKHDYDCPGSKKCCRTSCGRFCTEPIFF